ncbi:MAG: Ku protein [Gammaproteobacteria bacterium]
MHVLWSGSIVFGLVNIPVKLYSAVDETTLDFKMLHKKDHSAIRYAKICKEEDKEIPYSEVVKGYEINKGEYVILTDQNFKAANVKATQMIEIMEFSQESDIDSRYYDKPYYLEPDKGAAKAYALLTKALVQSKKVGIAKFVIHNREHLAALKVLEGNMLMLNRMRFYKELRSPRGLSLLDEKLIHKNELDMALTLIKQLTHKFKPENYHDTYAEDLLHMIHQKARGKTLTIKGEKTVKSRTPNLMKALQESLANMQKTSTVKKKSRRTKLKKAA